jgi:hypothetical protein
MESRKEGLEASESSLLPQLRSRETLSFSKKQTGLVQGNQIQIES